MPQITSWEIGLIITVVLAAAGWTFGAIKAAGASQYKVLEQRMKATENNCKESKNFQEESRKQNGTLWDDISTLKTDVAVLKQRQMAMGEQIDQIFHKMIG